MNIKTIKKFPKTLVLENVKQAKQLVDSGKLDSNDLKTFIERDPSKSKKYVGWMAKIWITDRDSIEDIHELSSYISEYDSFAQRNKVKTKDINQFKTYDNFKAEVDELNNIGADVSDKDLENDYDIIINLVGYVSDQSFFNFSLKEVNKTILINSIIPYLIIRNSLKNMIKQKFGRIVNTSSVGIKFGGGKKTFAYSLSKYLNEFIPDVELTPTYARKFSVSRISTFI